MAVPINPPQRPPDWPPGSQAKQADKPNQCQGCMCYRAVPNATPAQGECHCYAPTPIEFNVHRVPELSTWPRIPADGWCREFEAIGENK